MNTKQLEKDSAPVTKIILAIKRVFFYFPHTKKSSRKKTLRVTTNPPHHQESSNEKPCRCRPRLFALTFPSYHDQMWCDSCYHCGGKKSRSKKTFPRMYPHSSKAGANIIMFDILTSKPGAWIILDIHLFFSTWNPAALTNRKETKPIVPSSSNFNVSWLSKAASAVALSAKAPVNLRPIWVDEGWMCWIYCLDECH